MRLLLKRLWGRLGGNMFEAIHKLTKKRVSTFKLLNSLEWHGKERDEFIAPYETIENWEELYKEGIIEVKVSFVKAHKRYEGTAQEENVVAHFRIENDKARENLQYESEQHKLAKQYIYDKIEDIIIINYENKRISEIAEIEDIRIEKGVGEKRADVLITFKKSHPTLGKGIAFEVQISPQNEEKTAIRSFDRACYGYSIVWLWSEDLRRFNNFVKVIPFNLALKEYNENSLGGNILELTNIAEKGKVLTEEIKREIMSAVNINEKIKTQIKEEISEFELNSFRKFKEEITKSLVNELHNEKEGFIGACKNAIEYEKNELIKRFSEINIEEIIKSRINEIISKINIQGFVIDKARLCPRCGGKLHEYKNGDLICNDCPYHKLIGGANES